MDTYNCTDFGLEMSALVGLSIPDTEGSWGDTGSGSNPGNLGQDIRSDNRSGTTVNPNGGNAPKNSGSCP